MIQYVHAVGGLIFIESSAGPVKVVSARSEGEDDFRSLAEASQMMGLHLDDAVDDAWDEVFTEEEAREFRERCAAGDPTAIAEAEQ